jgi:hypothetical protein
MRRRTFLTTTALALTGATSGVIRLRSADRPEAGEPPLSPERKEEMLRLIAANRPSRLARLPVGFNRRVGATHVAGKYHLTGKPFLIEGADKLLELGTRLGKFWLIPRGIEGSYPFNSKWDKYDTLVSLARSDYFAQLLAMPFQTLLFEAHAPPEEGWKKAGLPESFYQRVMEEFHQLTAHLYRTCRDRDVTIILQHWEGDWFMRGAGNLWNPPPADWQAQCERMQRWLTARQAGVTKARAEFGAGAKCRVVHAAEVNRVTDAWKGVPTMTRNVLPGVELDLVSYSSYDGMRDGLTLWCCIEDIRRHARTGPLFGPGAVFVGEIGLPENEQKKPIAERWDEWLGALLAADVPYIVQWELFCNEFNPKLPAKPKTPIKDPSDVRGFWLVKPDGSLSEGGKYFEALWRRAAQAG